MLTSAGGGAAVVDAALGPPGLCSGFLLPIKGLLLAGFGGGAGSSSYSA